MRQEKKCRKTSCGTVEQKIFVMPPTIGIVIGHEAGEACPVPLFHCVEKMALMEPDLPFRLPEHEPNKSLCRAKHRRRPKRKCFLSILKSKMNYRANVAAILRNMEGQILICERINIGRLAISPGQCGQGRNPRACARPRALGGNRRRPARLPHCSEKRARTATALAAGQTKKGFHGKEQHYFLCDFRDLGIPASMWPGRTPEFRDYRWIFPDRIRNRAGCPLMKHEVYRAVLLDFFNVTI